MEIPIKTYQGVESTHSPSKLVHFKDRHTYLHTGNTMCACNSWGLRVLLTGNSSTVYQPIWRASCPYMSFARQGITVLHKHIAKTTTAAGVIPFSFCAGRTVGKSGGLSTLVNRYQHHQAAESLQGVITRCFLKVKVDLYERNQERLVLENVSSISWVVLSTSLTPDLHSVLSFYPTKHYSLQGTVLLGSAFQIQVLPPHKIDDNDFIFWSPFAHTTKPFLPEALQSTLLYSRNKNSLNRREIRRF